MKKNETIIALAIVGLVLLSACTLTAQKIAIGPILDVAVYIPESDTYITSGEGGLKNPYTNIIITKVGKIMKFNIYREDDGKKSSVVSVYKILQRKVGRRVIFAQKMDDGSGEVIKIIQKRSTTEIHCEYNDETNRFEGVIIIGDLDFTSLKSSSINYLNIN